MEFSIKAQSPEKSRSDCVVIAVNEAQQLSPSAQLLNDASGTYLAKLLRQGDLSGKVGKTLLVHNVPGVAAPRVLLVGTGKELTVNERDYRSLVRAAQIGRAHV